MVIFNKFHNYFREIGTVNKLTEGFTSTPHNKRFIFLFCQKTFMDQSGNNVGILKMKIIVGSINIGWNDTKIICTKLFIVAFTLNF